MLSQRLCHKHAIGKTYKRRKVPLGTKRIQQVQKQALKRVRDRSAQQVADLTIGGNALHAKQRLTVGAGSALLHRPLESKTGRRLQKEAGKPTQNGIGEGVGLQIMTKSNTHSDPNRTLHGGLSELDFAGLNKVLMNGDRVCSGATKTTRATYECIMLRLFAVARSREGYVGRGA